MDKKISILIFGTIINISLIVGAFYLGHRQGFTAGKTTQSNIDQIVYAPLKDAANKAIADTNNKANLNACLDNVDKWYNNNLTGSHPQSYWDALSTYKQQQIQECQLRN
jgi:hypothetical protein